MNMAKANAWFLETFLPSLEARMTNPKYPNSCILTQKQAEICYKYMDCKQHKGDYGLFATYELKTLEKKADSGSMSMSDIQLMDTLLHAKKNLLKSEEMADESEYSNGMAYSDGRGSYRYMDGNSYARRGRMNARRDSMGRYSSEGYSRAADDALTSLKEMERTATDEQTRQDVRRLITRMEQM